MMADVATISALYQLFEYNVCYAPARNVEKTAFRLDAGSFVGDASQDLSVQLRNRPTTTLGKLAQVFGFGPFKRTYIASPDVGIPLLTSSEMMEADPHPAIMAKSDCPNWEQYQIEHKWVLVSCSGTIGNVALVPRYWDGWAASQDAIRVVPQPSFRGLIWTFLSLPMVRQHIVSKKSGSVIDHIYPENIASLDLPVVSEQVMSRLNRLLDNVLDLREASRRIHDESVTALLTANSLPVIETIYSMTTETPEIVFIMNKALAADGGFRLDAHYYNMTAQLAVANIKKCRSEVRTVGDVARQVLMGPRFKRNYVESTHGVPFLSGKNIVQTRPTDLKYLSYLQMATMQELLVKKGWALVTCSGTIGRTCFVWQNYEGYAASQHILRVIPDESKIDPGYLYAFLTSCYGYEQILRYRHGSVIDEITDKQIEHVVIPYPCQKDQVVVGDMVREAYAMRAEAIRLEEDAQDILMKELFNAPVAKGV